MAKNSVTVIKSDAVVSIDVSGAYYNRVYSLMMRLIEMQPDHKQVLLNIDTPGTELSISEAVIQTFMMLLKSVEDEASKDMEKFTQVVEVDIK